MSIDVRIGGRGIGGWVAGSGSGVNLYENRQASIAVEEEEQMDEYPKVTLERIKSRRVVNIYIEIEKDKFITDDGATEEREVGQQMPIYDSVPEEYFRPILSAAQNSGFWDMARMQFR